MKHEDEEETNEAVCPGCGATASDWAGRESKGFISKTGEVYCCEACSRKEVCRCNSEKNENLVKQQSA